MDSALLDFLKKHKVFGSLDLVILKRLLPKFSTVEVESGQILFYQGEPSDSVFILISGKLAALTTDSNGQFKTVGHIKTGEIVGELGALSKEPRSLTIRAVKSSLLLKLPSKEFIDICYLYPAIMFATVYPIIERSQSIIQVLTADKSSNYITFAPINNVTLFHKFVTTFLKFAQDFPSLIIVSDILPNSSENPLDHTAWQEKINYLEHTKKRSQKMIFILKSFTSSLAKICLKKTDILYLVADAKMHPHIDAEVLNKIQTHQSRLETSPHLLLLHPANTIKPVNTKEWLKLTTFNMYHHLKIDSPRHYQRLLRFIRGKAVGLVLGGGGTRGWGHLGAIKALKENKTPIDMIGGSSVGAIIAACYAIDETFEDAHHRFRSIVNLSRGSTSWKSLTWPIISLFDGKKFTESLQNNFQDIQIEDLWLPYFCVSSNMSQNTEEIHRQGSLEEKTRCSSSVPGLIPPMLINGELHMDGGLLNNLPVDVMRKFLGKKARIIGIELNASLPNHRHYHFPPILTLKQAILAKLGISKENYKFPRFIDNLLSGLLIGSSAKTKQNGLTANSLISLNLNKFHLLNANLKQAEKMLETGYQATLAQINKEKKKDK